MNATGIIRRVDDLGRVVIPKEVRKRVGIKEGMPLEIFIDKDTVTFKKYSALSDSEHMLQYFGKTLKDKNAKCFIFNEFEEIVYSSILNYHIAETTFKDYFIHNADFLQFYSLELDCDMYEKSIFINGDYCGTIFCSTNISKEEIQICLDMIKNYIKDTSV